MSLPQGSRPSSAKTIVEDSKDGNRKANTDSGFHEDDHSTPSTSASGGGGGGNTKRNYRHHRRKNGDADNDSEIHKDRHDSLASMFSDIQDFSNYLENSSETSSLSSRIKYSASSMTSSESQRAVSAQNETTIKPTSAAAKSEGAVPEKRKQDDEDYEFPSDTELSEIIAIMSGLATPRKSLKGAEPSRSSEDCPSTPVTIHSDHYASSQGLSIDDDEDIVADLGKNFRDGVGVGVGAIAGRLYEKNNSYKSSNSNNIPNGKVQNGNVVTRRYLPKGVSTESNVSVNSVGAVKETSSNSLEDLIKASKSGKFPDKPPKKNKDSKKKQDKRPETAKKDVLVDEDPENKKPPWKERLKVYLTFIVSVGLILSSSSLLFIVPMFVDPILVGLEAQFSTIPAQCRTIRKRNGMGATDCAVPSCREGCTADLTFCYFIDVEYRSGKLPQSPTNRPPQLRQQPNSTKEGVTTTDGSHLDPAEQPQEGILLVNPNGCGYPPETNCTEFGKKFGAVNLTFPCYVSALNDSIVVPYYSHRDQVLHLSLFLLVPCGATIFFSTMLYLLMRWHPTAKRKRKKEKDEEFQELDSKNQESSCNGVEVKINTGHIMEGPDDGTLRLNLNKMLATAPPMPLGNGTLGNIMSDLAGITSNNFIQKRNYTKFHTSEPNSLEASRTNSFDTEHPPPPATDTKMSRPLLREQSNKEESGDGTTLQKPEYNPPTKTNPTPKESTPGPLLSNGHISHQES